MKKAIVLVVLIFTIILTSGCTSSSYKDYMKKGNDAMVEKEYAQAVEAFSLAVEEEPKQEEAKEKLKKAKDKQLVEEMKSNVKDGKKAIEEKEFSKGIKKLKKVIAEKTDNKSAKKIQSDTTKYLDSIRKEIVGLIQDNVEVSREAIGEGNYEAAGSLMTLTELNYIEDSVKAFILEKEDINPLLDEIAEISNKAKAMKEAKELEVAQKQAEEQKKAEEEAQRIAQEQAELEMVKEHPERFLTISDIKIEEHESWDSFDVNFTLKNTSKVDFERVECKVTLLDSNNNPMTSEPNVTYELPAGEFQQRFVSFFDLDSTGVKIKVEVIEATE